MEAELTRRVEEAASASIQFLRTLAAKSLAERREAAGGGGCSRGRSAHYNVMISRKRKTNGEPPHLYDTDCLTGSTNLSWILFLSVFCKATPEYYGQHNTNNLRFYASTRVATSSTSSARRRPRAVTPPSAPTTATRPPARGHTAYSLIRRHFYSLHIRSCVEAAELSGCLGCLCWQVNTSVGDRETLKA